MSEREWSIADRFVHVLAEVRRIDADVTNGDKHAYPIRKLRQAAEKVLYEACITAAEIADSAQAFKREIAEKK